jgi:hypothetical protein
MSGDHRFLIGGVIAGLILGGLIGYTLPQSFYNPQIASLQQQVSDLQKQWQIRMHRYLT